MVWPSQQFLTTSNAITSN